MTSQKDLEQEVHDAIAAALKQDKPVSPIEMTASILLKHGGIIGEDTDWYRVCAFGHVRSTLGRVLRRFELSPEEAVERQLVLPGFERLQVAYLVQRGDDRQLVPTTQLTDDEIDQKAGELDQMSIGCAIHAKELRRYRQDRAQVLLSIPAPSQN